MRRHGQSISTSFEGRPIDPLRRLLLGASAPPRSPRDVAAARSLSRRRLLVGLCTLVAAWVSYAIYSETAAGHSADQHVTELQRQNDALRVEIDQRKREIGAAQTASWIVEEARRLGYVLTGERVFVPVASNGRLPGDGGIDPGPLPAPPTPTPTPGAGVATTPGPRAGAGSPTQRSIGVPLSSPTAAPAPGGAAAAAAAPATPTPAPH